MNQPNRDPDDRLTKAVAAVDDSNRECALLLERALAALEPAVIRGTFDPDAREAGAALVDEIRAAVDRRRGALEELARVSAELAKGR